MAVDSERIVQNRVIGWLVELGYTYLGNLTAEDNTPIKENLLRDNLRRRGYTDDEIKKSVNELTDAAGNQTDGLFQINQSVYSLLRYGSSSVKNSKGQHITVHYVDWENISANDFYIAEEVSVLCRDGIHRKRPDLVFYINGIALGICELKNSAVSVGEGIRQMLTNQKAENISRFFSTAQLLFAGNESQGISYGTIKTPEKFYFQWREDKNATDALSSEIKNLHGNDNNRLRAGIISLCHKERFLSLIHDFTVFDGGIKKVVRHNQYFAIKAAEQKITAFFARTTDERGGIIWDTQGSGKSLIMVWLAKWIKENIYDGRIVIITDREELDDQIEGVFMGVNEKIRRAKSCADLREILNGHSDNIICSLIHKYGTQTGADSDVEIYKQELLKNLPPNFKAKGNIVAFIDECHRTNSGVLHAAVKTLMPDAFIIGFTGTPLLHSDKKNSRETFGDFIHTYKFNEGVADGIILDLRYEPRDIDQNLTSPEEIDSWFDEKTTGLTERAKSQLKQKWATLKNLYSSKHRLEKIVADIICDMNFKPRLKSGRGNAMLVAGSIYEACRLWEIFNAEGFTKCAVVTSYEPTPNRIRTATTDLNVESEEEYKNRIYTLMLDGKNPADFEKQVKEAFKKRPDEMKLLIVVDKLLTGFDAPGATYIYIDKKMRDHELFQTICRVNRPDSEDKDFGYIIDYKDLFKSVQAAVKDYTTEAFEGYDKADIEGLIKNRYDEATNTLEISRKALREIFSEILPPQADSDIIDYFCDSADAEQTDETKSLRRNIFYSRTAEFTRAFANCCDRLVSHYGYTEKGVDDLRKDVAKYNRIKQMIKLASCDYIDLKPYDADMRNILDTYIVSDDSKIIGDFDGMTLTELFIDGKIFSSPELLTGLAGNEAARAAIIENNLNREIRVKMDSNSIYYGDMSEKLQNLISQRKAEKLSYAEYLKQVAELAREIFHPEEKSSYPAEIRNSEAKRALYDFLGKDAALTMEIDRAIKNALEPNWKDNTQKQKKILRAIYKKLTDYQKPKKEAEALTRKLFNEIVMNQREYPS